MKSKKPEVRLNKEFFEQKEWESEGSFRAEVDTRPSDVRFEFGRLGFLRFFVLGVFFLLGWRLFSLQIVAGDSYRQEAEGNRIRTFGIPAMRGIIYDRNGNLLVRNIPSFQLVFVPADLPQEESEREDFFDLLAEILEVDSTELKKIALEAPPDSYEPHILVRDMDREKALVVGTKLANIPGFMLSSFPIREYIEGSFVAHILGYLGKISEEEYAQKSSEGYFLTDYIGKQGVEFSYEKPLRGKSGRETVEVDSRGKIEKILGIEPPESGQSLKLALDLELQRKLYEEMRLKLEEIDAQRGAAVALDPQTGRILGLVSIPDFDNNLFARGISPEDFSALREDESKPLFHRSVAGEYPPGSTIKPLIAVAALEEKVISARRSLHCGGSLLYQGWGGTIWRFPDWKAHGPTDLRKAIAESCDVYFYSLGGGNEAQGVSGLGIEKIKIWGQGFGLNQTLGLDLPGEATGLIPDPAWKEAAKAERWYIGDTYHASIGQGDILVSPLQITNNIAAIANGGTLYRPKIGYSFLDEITGEETEIKPEIIRQGLASPENLALVRAGMRDTVRYGSARTLNALQVSVAGKTGTAQFAGGGDKTHAWFTCFAPYEHPEIALTILVEGGGDGDKVAVPIAENILRWYFDEPFEEPVEEPIKDPFEESSNEPSEEQN